MILNLLITRKEWDDHKTDYFAVSSLCPIISRQPPSGGIRLYPRHHRSRWNQHGKGEILPVL